MLDGGDFLATLDPAARDALSCLGGHRPLVAGNPVFVEGERANRVVIIHAGVVRVSTIQRDGTEALLGLRGPGELIGEVSMLDGLPRSASAAGLTAGRIQFIDGDAFEDFLFRFPAAAIAMARTLASRLREATEAQTAYGADAVPTRLARTLLSVADRFGHSNADGSLEIDLPLSQEDLGGLVGASRDSVARTLRKWRECGLVTTGRRTITLLDVQRLRDRAR